jgi:hypothetical protein
MANVLSPFGLAYQGLWGGAAAASASRLGIPLVATTAAIYSGDPVKIAGDGYCVPWTAGTGVSQLYGIFAGCEYLATANNQWLPSNYWPGSGAVSGSIVQGYVIPCIGSPPPWFLVQTANSAGADVAVTQADVGQNIDVAMVAGNARTGISGTYADTNTLGTAATLPFRIMALYGGNMPLGGALGPGSDAASANNWIWVMANVQQLTGI